MELIKLIHNRYIKEVGIYITALCLCMVTLAWVMKLWDADLDIPFSYDGDGLFTSMVVKGLIDNGWVQHNNFVGFPGGQVLYDFPINNYIDIIILKLLTFIMSNYAATMNTYYPLTFPLTTVE
jgi:phosphoglycerol transferase